MSVGERGTRGFRWTRAGAATVVGVSNTSRAACPSVLIDTEKESIPDCGAVGTFDRGFWENGRGHERRTELVTPLSVTRSTSTDRVDMVPRFQRLKPGKYGPRARVSRRCPARPGTISRGR